MVSKSIEIFKTQKMLVISDVPEADMVTQQVYDVISQMNETHETTSKVFSVRTDKSTDGMLSHMNNIFSHGNALENAAKLGYKVEDSSDLLTKIEDLPIKGYKNAVGSLTNQSMLLGAMFVKIIDNGNPGESNLESILKQGEIQKFRFIKVPVVEYEGERRKDDSVCWHYDVGFATVLYKNRFFRHGKDGKI